MRIDVESHISYPARQIVSVLNNAGYKAYYVGGCVRDILLKIKPHDFDIATNATPEQVTEVFSRHGYNIHDVGNGKKHGTVVVAGDIEITTFRKEGTYSDGRRPDYVEFVQTLEEDLARRDFTINAMAIDQYGNLIDPFDGQLDLERKVIHCVGSVSDRLNQDAIRVLRAIRFSCKLGFTMDDLIFKFLYYNSTILEEKGISVERIREEICKILLTKQAMEGMRLIISTGLISHIIPEFGSYDSTFLLEHYSSDLINRLSCLLYGQSRNVAENILRRLKFDGDTFNKVSTLSYHVNEVEPPIDRKKIKLIINSLGVELVDAYYKLRRQLVIHDSHGSLADLDGVDMSWKIANEIIEYREPLTIKDLAVDGNDLIKAGVNPGKRIGLTLNYLMYRVLGAASLNTKDHLMALVQERES